MALSNRNPDRYLGDRSTAGHPVLGATRARAGRLGRPVLWVLIFSTLLAALALFGAWTWKSGDLNSANAAHNALRPQAKTFDAPQPAPITVQSGQAQQTPANPG